MCQPAGRGVSDLIRRAGEGTGDSESESEESVSVPVMPRVGVVKTIQRGDRASAKDRMLKRVRQTAVGNNQSEDGIQPKQPPAVQRSALMISDCSERPRLSSK